MLPFSKMQNLRFYLAFYFKFGEKTYATNKKMANRCTSLYALVDEEVILGSRATIVICMRCVYGKNPGSLPVGSRSHECDKLLLLINFACNTIDYSYRNIK